MMQIGNYHFPHGLVLAPMAGVTDSPFRALCKSFGAELVVSEMISAKGMHYKDKKTNLLAAYKPEEMPIAIQLFGSDPDIMAEAATLLCALPDPPQIIDVNMGCPMKKIVSNGDGSALMRTPDLAGKIIEKMVKAVSIPVTVKFRTGWDEAHKNAPEFAKQMEAAGATAITIHGRTKEQLYAPPVDLSSIENVCKAVSIPVIGNGSIETVADAKQMLSLGCQGIALGRSACGKPWLFAQIAQYLDGKNYTEPTLETRFQVAKKHLALAIEAKGEWTAVREMRWHLAKYLYGLKGAASARDAINHAESGNALEAILDEIIEMQD